MTQVKEFQDYYLVVDGELSYLIEKRDVIVPMLTNVHEFAIGRVHDNWKLPSADILDSMKRNRDQLKLYFNKTILKLYIGELAEHDILCPLGIWVMSTDMTSSDSFLANLAFTSTSSVISRLVNTDPTDLEKYRGSIYGAKFGI